jgi:tetratricopeptide (TPR) repeat protein
MSLAIVLTLAFALILALTFPYIATTVIALGFTFAPMRLEAIEAEQIPSEIRNLMQPWIDRAFTADFQIVSYQLVHTGFLKDPPHWGIVLQHSSAQFFVTLLVKPKPDLRYPVICSFSSCWQDSHLLTINIGNFSTYSKSNLERINHLDRASFDELWASHQSFVNSICASDLLVTMTVEEWKQKLEATSIAEIEFRAQKKEIYWVDRQKNIYRRHPWLTLKAVTKIYVNSKLQKKLSSNSVTSIDSISLESEIQTYLARSIQTESKQSPRQHIWLLLASIGLFATVYATQFKFAQLLIFILALLLHESGHILAMRACGYRDTKMLFIPWLGALATGKKENASIPQKVWVSLAGPLPGLILGIVLAISFPNRHDWVSDARMMLIGLNLFNLLPIYPLDGGKVVDVLIFSRRPYLGIIFQSIGLLLLGALGLNQPVLLFFVILLAVQMPVNFRLAKLRLQFEADIQDLDTLDRETLVRTIFRYLATNHDYQLSPPQKNLFVDNLTNDRYLKSNRSTKLGLSVIYLISLIGGFIGGLYAIVPNLDTLAEIPYALLDAKHSVQRYSQKKIDLANRQLQQNPNNISAYLKRGRGYYGLQKYALALNDADRVITLDPNNSEAYRLRSEVHLRMGDLAGAKKDLQQSQTLFWQSQLQAANLQIQQQNNNVSAYIQRSNAKKMLGDRQGALADYNAVIKLQPNSTEALLGRAYLAMEIKKYREALVDINLVVNIEPKNAEAYQLRSDLYERMGDRTRAETDRQYAELLNDN